MSRVRANECGCEYCDPLLWTQAQSALYFGLTNSEARTLALRTLGTLAELVRDAAHPEQRKERPR